MTASPTAVLASPLPSDPTVTTPTMTAATTAQPDDACRLPSGPIVGRISHPTR